MELKYKQRDWKNYIICVKMFTRPTLKTLEIIPKEEYSPRRYRYFGSADTYDEAVDLMLSAYDKFLEMKIDRIIEEN